HPLRELRLRRRQVEKNPVDPRSGGCVGIVEDQREGVGFGGRLAPREWWGEVVPIAGLSPWNLLALAEGGAFEDHFDALRCSGIARDSR
ncbi:MAG TPA: hypothetical protein VLA09_11035, partial [Longimicrobiales bacterium]|nr:hypothetical protein [Longimicrobiales bacterium]